MRVNVRWKHSEPTNWYPWWDKFLPVYVGRTTSAVYLYLGFTWSGMLGFTWSGMLEIRMSRKGE